MSKVLVNCDVPVYSVSDNDFLLILGVIRSGETVDMRVAARSVGTTVRSTLISVLRSSAEAQRATAADISVSDMYFDVFIADFIIY
jgi:hypothetical protein